MKKWSIVFDCFKQKTIQNQIKDAKYDLIMQKKLGILYDKGGKSQFF